MPDLKVIIKADRGPAGEHDRWFNTPAINEIAIILVGEKHGKYEIVLKNHNKLLSSIKGRHRSYDCF